jgi:hypothetical protein
VSRLTPALTMHMADGVKAGIGMPALQADRIAWSLASKERIIVPAPIESNGVVEKCC